MSLSEAPTHSETTDNKLLFARNVIASFQEDDSSYAVWRTRAFDQENLQVTITSLEKFISQYIPQDDPVLSTEVKEFMIATVLLKFYRKKVKNPRDEYRLYIRSREDFFKRLKGLRDLTNNPEDPGRIVGLPIPRIGTDGRLGLSPNIIAEVKRLETPLYEELKRLETVNSQKRLEIATYLIREMFNAQKEGDFVVFDRSLLNGHVVKFENIHTIEDFDPLFDDVYHATPTIQLLEGVKPVTGVDGEYATIIKNNCDALKRALAENQFTWRPIATRHAADYLFYFSPESEHEELNKLIEASFKNHTIEAVQLLFRRYLIGEPFGLQQIIWLPDYRLMTISLEYIMSKAGLSIETLETLTRDSLNQILQESLPNNDGNKDDQSANGGEEETDDNDLPPLTPPLSPSVDEFLTLLKTPQKI